MSEYNYEQLRIAAVPSEIRTAHLPNASHKCYRLT
jgi:hypothetical protein